MRSLRQQAAVSIFAILTLIFLVACGGSNYTQTTTPPVTAGGQNATATALVNVGDAPGDRVVSFTVTINSIALVPQSGSPVTILSTPSTIEVTKLAGTTLALGTAKVPQGTYTGAQIVIANATVAILNPDGATKTVTLPPGPTTVNVKLESPVTAGSSPVAINF